MDFIELKISDFSNIKDKHTCLSYTIYADHIENFTRCKSIKSWILSSKVLKVCFMQ